mmetsp:Transcript_30572/g.36347  ORF Transcript_30572/g.36347 Transcript_30572/m.36347 type:complete len:173 (-) Transcript_30572:344-862(-)|eukprot:CAMPEP_0198261534 /NCGR_PEP_ID=MMETSP1447-20131203/10238_1 /TAXON_ID=420782 /ORGANISM="Chaetoceros dichaeta, Strain CCMP1751" /LENGTH=172 /DNA_ID=CAMNT_0043949479 /DNA_START=159 /DNA_END=677 /DNA_ORIENTATION=-
MAISNNAEDTTKEDESNNAALEKELQKRAPRVMSHMNGDHQDSIKAYALAFGDHPDCVNTESAILTGLDRNGFLLEVTLSNGTKLDNVRVPYVGDVTSGKDLHMMAIKLHRLAYDKIGFVYKIKNGYYKQVAQMIGFQAYKKMKGRPGTTGALTVAIIAILGGTFASRLRLN